MGERRIIETAPKDGSEIELQPHGSDQWYVGYWAPEGNSWVDKDGNPGGIAHHLEVTGCWFLDDENSWFESTDVAFWRPIKASQ